MGSLVAFQNAFRFQSLWAIPALVWMLVSVISFVMNQIPFGAELSAAERTRETSVFPVLVVTHVFREITFRELFSTYLTCVFHTMVLFGMLFIDVRGQKFARAGPELALRALHIMGVQLQMSMKLVH